MESEDVRWDLTATIAITKHNVGRIAERIVSNELEYRGFRVSDLNKEGMSANADLLAARKGKTWQIQVKGATADDGWWFGYGFCSEAVIAGEERMFNRSANSFYKAEIVILVSVKSPWEYTSLVLPIEIAEKAAQINLDANFRTLKKNGEPHKPGKVWASLEWTPKSADASREDLYLAEQDLLRPHKDNWECFPFLP